MDIINHVEIPVVDVEASRRFYEAVLAPLGMGLIVTIDPARTAHGGYRHGFGRDGYPSLWIHERPGAKLPVHIAFTVADKMKVDAFHQAALTAGGTDNGGPGVRERYHPSYYAAYVLDPDGNNVEAVCQTE
ncbi:VOC family protein [Hansschlegelia sp. KR7-227]|uniref:VOC family protein n=1 Tax=Hansschlegelia sp. KR7-227 TaxID=3400914 RepID=UPI003C0719FD